MSPEQARGEDLDARTDIFSLGVVLYEMATGRQAFSGQTSASVFDEILHSAPVSVARLNPKAPQELDQILSKALEKDRRLRYPTASGLRADLERLKRDLDSGRAAAAPPAAAEKSLAVLYFENLSRASEDEYFRDGMTEDIITELSKVKNLKVFQRVAVLAYRDKPTTAVDVGRELGAAYVLTGSLRRAGNRLRITTQLLETRTGFPLWAEKVDRELQDVFEVQDEIAHRITEALRVALSPQEEKAIARKPTENLQAYDHYLRGRSYARRGTRSDLEVALEMFGRAIAVDPGFPIAHAGIAHVCGLFHYFHEQEAKWVERGMASCERALAIDPELPEGLAARAFILYAQRKFDEAIRFARLAIDRKPNCEGAYYTLGRAYFESDRFEEAAEVADRAIEASGDDYNVYIPYGLALERLNRKEAAERVRGLLLQILERQLEQVPDDVRARILLSVNYAAYPEKADLAVRHLEMAMLMRPHDTNVLYNAACTFAILGRKQEALGALKKAHGAGSKLMQWAARDPDLASLHGEPEFEELIRRAAAKAEG
jgi:TolB-like protein/Flp pilus assembly protein TadD